MVKWSTAIQVCGLNHVLKRSEHVIQQDDLGMRVHGSRKRDSRFLSSTQRKTLFSYFRLITSFKQLKVTFKATLMDDLIITLLVKGCAEYNVVLSNVRLISPEDKIEPDLNGLVLNP